MLDRLVPAPPHGDPVSKPVLTAVPVESVSEFWLPLASFDYSRKAKNGCGVLETWGSCLLVGQDSK